MRDGAGGGEEEEVAVVGEVTQAQKDAAGRSEAIDLEAQLFPSDLCTAAQEGNTALIEEALQAGIAVDGADPDGKTALMTAGEAGELDHPGGPGGPGAPRALAAAAGGP